jgi:Uma2 family endonuclease
MATTISFQEQIEIPFVQSLREFRDWATSDDCPEKVRIDYIAGRIEVDMSPEDLFTHGTLKTRMIGVLDTLVNDADLGEIFTDATRVSSPEADLSAEPDIVIVFHESLQTGRVRLVPKASGQPDRYIELEGAPDLVVEIVSDNSVAKDTQRLPQAYWRAGIPEFWLADARGSELVFRIHRRGTTGYDSAPSDPEGFQHSAIFNAWFRLARRRHHTGRWRYALERKQGS